LGISAAFKRDQSGCTEGPCRTFSGSVLSQYDSGAVTSTTATGGGVFISDADIAAGKKAYILARVNYIQASPAVSWDDIQGFIDFASQVGGDDT
jgi:hypothetical protein